jgi:hypothetical protein
MSPIMPTEMRNLGLTRKYSRNFTTSEEVSDGAHVFHFTRSDLFLCTECPSAAKGHHVGVMSYRTRSVASHVPGIDITPSPAITPETLPPTP